MFTTAICVCGELFSVILCCPWHVGVVGLQLRSPMQIVMAIDGEQKEELENMIHDLEEENK